MPAETTASGMRVGAVELTHGQARVARSSDEVLCVWGGPASGKTAALAVRARACLSAGQTPLVVCSHPSGVAAFEAALASLGEPRAPVTPSIAATLSDHATAWLRSAYLSAGAAPEVVAGGTGAARFVLERAARGLLDMTWPAFARSDLDLDVPHLSKPESFLDDAAALFELLQRARVTPVEFEEGCAAGLAAFYGQGVERAVALLGDPLARERMSARGRAACSVPVAVLERQRAAERASAMILAQLYRDYLDTAAASTIRSPEDAIDAAIGWLESDERGARALAERIDLIVVDDAEDAEPGLVPAIAALCRHRRIPVVLAGDPGARVDGLAGRRSALDAFPQSVRVELAPLGVLPAPVGRRFEDETREADWLAREIDDLLREGEAPQGIAVLTRTVQAARVYAGHLRERGIQVVMPSAVLERNVEMSDLLALCAVVEDPLDQAALLRVLAAPLVGLSDASLWALCKDPAERLQLSLYIEAAAPASESAVPKPDTLAKNVLFGDADATLDEEARARVSGLRGDLTLWRERCCGMSRVERFAYLAGAAGFRDRWHAAPDWQRARLADDLTRVTAAVAQADDLGGALDFTAVADLLEADVVPMAPAPRRPGAIVVDSIVAVKGSRFDHVFVAGVAHERFPRIYTSRAMAFSRTYGLIVRENVAGGASQTAKYAWYYARFGAKNIYLDEERRALSYGLSRARKSARASGFGTPPRWARGHDLLAGLEDGEPAPQRGAT